MQSRRLTRNAGGWAGPHVGARQWARPSTLSHSARRGLVKPKAVSTQPDLEAQKHFKGKESNKPSLSVNKPHKVRLVTANPGGASSSSFYNH